MKKYLLVLVFIIAVILPSYSVIVDAYEYTASYGGFTFTVSVSSYDTSYQDATDVTYTVTINDDTRTFSYTEINDGTYTAWLMSLFGVAASTPVPISASPSPGGSGFDSGLNNLRLQSTVLRNRNVTGFFDFDLNPNRDDKKEKDEEEKEDEESTNGTVISNYVVPYFSTLNNDGFSRTHLAAGYNRIMESSRFIINISGKPWLNIVDSDGDGAGDKKSYLGLDGVGQFTFKIKDEIEAAAGVNFGISNGILNGDAEIEGFNTNFGLFGSGTYYYSRYSFSGGLAFTSATLEEKIWTYDTAIGLNATAAVTNDMFASLYFSRADNFLRFDVPEEGFSIMDIPDAESIITIEIGGSVGYYFTDAIYFELGFQFITPGDGDTIFGLSLGTTYAL